MRIAAAILRRMPRPREGGSVGASRMRALIAICLAVIPAAVPRAAPAVETAPWPSRPIRIVVPFTAGNQLDVFARLVGERLGTALGQPVIVEDRPGASGNVASEVVAKSPPDGYTLLVTGSLITLLPHTYGSRAVDPVTAFAPVTRLARQPIVIVASAASGIGSMADLIAQARREPRRIAYATSGVGTAQHITMTMLAERAGIELYHVPYSNSGQLIGDVLSGQVPLALSFPGTVEPHLKSGRLKALAVTSGRRAVSLPEVPTITEAGFPGFDVYSWAGMLAPAGTPPEIVGRLNREIRRIIALPDVREAFLQQSAEPVGNTPEEFAAEIRTAVARWGPLVKAAGIKAD